MSPVPPPVQPSPHEDQQPQTLPYPRPSPPKPLVRLHLDDLSHEATKSFLDAINSTTVLQEATKTVLKWLYDFQDSDGQESSTDPSPNKTPSDTSTNRDPTPPSAPWPALRSITLFLRPIGGVAYTTSNPLDEDHKEIHVSLAYIAQAAKSSRLHHEVTGVLVHEMVHVWQSYGDGTSAPGGLTEGIADFVRLKAGLGPPHWKRQSGSDGRKWNDGYETTGYFLEWLEDVKVGKGTVKKCNAKLRDGKYDEKEFWNEICGAEVQALWDEYGEWLGKQKKEDS